MYYVYVLKSDTHGTRYIGSTADIEKRVVEHNKGKCRYTSGRRPWQLVYQESYQNRGETMKREAFLKTGKGRMELDSILA